MARESGPLDNRQEIPLEALRVDIERQQKLLLDLEAQFNNAQRLLPQLIETYRNARFRQQEALWHRRCLTRCTMCYRIPPSETTPRHDKRIATAWGGWGLMPMDDAHFVVMSGTRHYRGKEYSGDRDETFVALHRLCTNCYQIELRGHAAHSRPGGIQDLEERELTAVNRALTSGDENNIKSVLERHFGRSEDMRVVWHNLVIPEGAYEIGREFSLKEDFLLNGEGM